MSPSACRARAASGQVGDHFLVAHLLRSSSASTSPSLRPVNCPASMVARSGSRPLHPQNVYLASGMVPLSPWPKYRRPPPVIGDGTVLPQQIRTVGHASSSERPSAFRWSHRFSVAPGIRVSMCVLPS